MTYQPHQSEDVTLKVGDSIQCEVRHPYPRTIRMRLMEPAAVAYANELLANPASGWTRTPGVTEDRQQTVPPAGTHGEG